MIVADGALQFIPFGVLQEPGRGSGESAPLMVRHEIVSAPSASAVALLRADRAGTTPHTQQVAIFADPVFSASDPRARRRAAAQSTRAPANGDAASAGEEALRSAADLGIAGFRRLRFSREEAEAISSLVPTDQRLAALDFAASRGAVMTGDLGRFRIVHFSTHALLNNVHPELSGLVLSLIDDRGEPQDGFLRLHEIHNLALTADLVVLSACETALGAQVRGEGLIGLARGFMYAGASRVVASLWNVEDQATAHLMEEFYRRMLVDREPPAAALRAAQIAMWKSSRWRSPYYWAPFVIQGEWR
jgi:CHAT domain-containing protein